MSKYINLSVLNLNTKYINTDIRDIIVVNYLIRDEYVLNVLDKIQKSLITEYKRNVTKKEALVNMAEYYTEKKNV